MTDLATLSKDTLIDITRRVVGKVGDTGRNPKEHYVALLSDPQHAAQAQMVATELAKPATPPQSNGWILTALAELTTRVDSLIVANQTVSQRVIVQRGESQHEIEGFTHAAFDDVLQLAGLRQPILLVGPPGCGKATVAQQVADGMGLLLSQRDDPNPTMILIHEITNADAGLVRRQIKHAQIIATATDASHLSPSVFDLFACVPMSYDVELERKIVDSDILEWAQSYTPRPSTRALVRMTAQKANLDWGIDKITGST